MPTCEYCGEDFTKGGAYATHVRYCDDRPETEEGERSDVSEEGGDQGIAIEISDSRTESRSPPQERDESTRVTPGEHEAAGDPGAGGADDRSAGRWLAALVLVIVVVFVLRLLGRDDD